MRSSQAAPANSGFQTPRAWRPRGLPLVAVVVIWWGLSALFLGSDWMDAHRDGALVPMYGLPLVVGMHMVRSWQPVIHILKQPSFRDSIALTELEPQEFLETAIFRPARRQIRLAALMSLPAGFAAYTVGLGDIGAAYGLLEWLLFGVPLLLCWASGFLVAEPVLKLFFCRECRILHGISGDLLGPMILPAGCVLATCTLLNPALWELLAEVTGLMRGLHLKLFLLGLALQLLAIPLTIFMPMEFGLSAIAKAYLRTEE